MSEGIEVPEKIILASHSNSLPLMHSSRKAWKKNTGFLHLLESCSQTGSYPAAFEQSGPEGQKESPAEPDN